MNPCNPGVRGGANPIRSDGGRRGLLNDDAAREVHQVERVLSTFPQSFIGGAVVTQPLNGSMWYAAVAGGVGAVLALGKGLVAR
ncbi:hypothetical protein MBT84_49215 [Streptomyces sp. MBT84]|nr:hypothetical protein [Streptomyces sp. MBT84]